VLLFYRVKYMAHFSRTVANGHVSSIRANISLLSVSNMIRQETFDVNQKLAGSRVNLWHGNLTEKVRNKEK